MKKVGIVTFHRAANYGAVLQTYALQQVLLKEGLDCKVVDFRGDRVDIHYSGRHPAFTPNKSFIQSLYKYIAAWIHYPLDKKKRRIFDSFINEMLVLSRSCSNKEELSALSNDYDFFFCGSDQVWNLGCIDHEGAYFLDFADPCKRNSYAASIGTESIADEDLLEYKNNLEGFNCISVREEKSAYELSRVSNKEVMWVLDPTLLLSKESWDVVSEPIDVPKEYVLVYVLYDLDNNELFEFIKNFSKEKNLPVVTIGRIKRLHVKGKIEVLPNPKQWVWLFSNAKFVVTNSFHGTLFSINFQKEFYTGLLVPETRSANIRMKDILRYCNLTDRIIEYDDTERDRHFDNIDWDSVSDKILSMRIQSMDFIRKVEGDYCDGTKT